jgi:hypothetical protein
MHELWAEEVEFLMGWDRMVSLFLGSAVQLLAAV